MLEPSQRAQLSARPVIFGEVLFDCFPDGRAVLGGAPFNVAWHLSGFGIKPLFVSRVGRDDKGKEILDSMKQWGMDVSGMQQDYLRPTGVVEVGFDERHQPHYEIADNQAYDYIRPGEVYGCVSGETFGLVYHGTLGLRQPEGLSSLSIFIEQLNLPSFVDLNLRAPWWSADLVERVLNGAAWIKLNEDELEQIPLENTDDLSLREQSLYKHYQPELLIVTKGERGAAITEASATIETAATPLNDGGDTVGAGDAFSAVCIAGLINGWPSAQILERAQQFAAAICGVNGALVNDPAFYRQFRQQWEIS